jgi:two-component system, LuxR family, sensor kinase FixL
MRIALYARDAAVFAPCYLLLDWVSYIDPLGPFNITPWNPQPALAIAWMLIGGLAHAPAVLGAILLADVLVRDLPGGLLVTFTTALMLAAGYTGIAWALGWLLRPKPSLHTLRQLTVFMLVVVAGTAVIAACFIGTLVVSRHLDSAAAFAGWLRFWVGDAVGILVTAPLLLVVADREQRERFGVLTGRGETYAQAAILTAALWLIFAGLGGDPSHHVYLLFLPLIWLSIRNGLPGAIIAVAIVQLGVVLGIHHRSLAALPVVELQALVAALTLTALYLGVMVDERSRANASLRQSLGLAAAGEMAGAIAHEVNQPLTALTNYGRSGQLLLRAGRSAELSEVLEKILAEAQRASEVVRRLRDFFRGGTTRLERIAVAELLDSARSIGGTMKASSAIAFRVHAGDGMPDVLVDRLQIEVVLRNLIANAVESVSAKPDGGEVVLSAARHDAARVRIVVRDTGAGIRSDDTERVFQPFVSDKPTGMGLGLAVSRAIVEAHGGTLEARGGTHGEFHLILPIGAHG